MRRYLLLALGILALVSMLTPRPVWADVASSPRAIPVGTLECSNGQTVTLVSPTVAPPIAQVVSTNQVLVTTRLMDVARAGEVTLYDVVISYAAGHGQAVGIQGSLVTCQTDYQFEDPALGTVHGHLTVEGFLTPRRQ